MRSVAACNRQHFHRSPPGGYSARRTGCRAHFERAPSLRSSRVSNFWSPERLRDVLRNARLCCQDLGQMSAEGRDGTGRDPEASGACAQNDAHIPECEAFTTRPFEVHLMHAYHTQSSLSTCTNQVSTLYWVTSRTEPLNVRIYSWWITRSLQEIT